MDSTADAYPIHRTPSVQPAEELLATLPWGLVVVDDHQVIQRINQQAARWCGDTPEALLGQALSKGGLPAAMQATLLSLLETGEAGVQEVFLPELKQWISFSSAPHQPHGWVLYGQDITPQKQRARAEEALAASEEKYRTLFDSIDEGFCTVEVLFDAQGQATDYRFLDVNPAFEKQTGLQGALGKTMRELAPAHEQHWFDTYGRVARTGESTRFEAPGEALGRWFDVNAFPLGTPPHRHVGVLFIDSTERKRTEEALRRSEEQYRLLVTATADTVYRMNADWTQMKQLLGKSFLADTLDSTRTWMEEYIPASDLLQVQASIAEAIQHKNPFELEHRVRQADGTVGWTYSRAIPVLDAQGELTSWLGTASDITARKQAEAGLRESEQRQRVLIENLPGAAVFVVDRELRYQLAAGEALRPAGFEPAEFQGRTVREVIPPAYWPAFRDTFQQALAGQVFEHEHEQGGRNFVSRGVPLPGLAGQVEAVLVVSYDITDRKVAEEALQASEVKYRTLFETMDQGFGIGEVLLAGPGQAADFRWLQVNPQVERLTGMPRAALLSGETMRTVMPQLEDIWYERYERIALTGEPMRFEQHAQVLDRWFDVYAYALDLDGPAPHRVALLFTNITARKQAEEALRLAEERHRQELEQQVAARTQELQESRYLLRTVFDASPTAIVVLRILRDAASRAEDFEILLYNEFNQQVVGRDDLVGQRFTALFPQTVPTGILARLLAVATTGEPADFEQWYVGEGMQHWFRHIVVRQEGLLVLTSEVITARKQAEQERARTLRLLEQAEAVAGLGSWDYDLLSQEFLWSEGMYQLFGLPMSQPVRPDIYLQYVLDEDRPRAEQLVQRLRTGSGSFEDTLRLRVSEQVKTVRIKSVVLTDEAGQPVRVLGVDLDISELQRLEADNLRLRLSQQQALFEAVQAAQEVERKRMAESLHNGIGQLLFATKLRLDRLHAPVLHTLPALVAARNEADQLLSEAIRQTRVLSHELVPLVLEEFGLVVALQDIGHKMSTPQLRFRCQVQLDEDVAPLTPALQMALYRMAQELALNISKHAHGTTEASLELETMPGWVLLRAEDNGPGFGANPAAEGLGLRSMRDRVALLGGQLKTGAISPSGAYVRIRIPYPTSPTP